MMWVQTGVQRREGQVRCSLTLIFSEAYQTLILSLILLPVQPA